MKQRLISLFFAFLLLAAVIALFDTFFLNVVLAAICVLAVREVYQAYKIPWWYIGALLPLLFLLPVPAQRIYENAAFIAVACIAVTFLIVMAYRKRRVPFAEAAAATLETLLITFGFGCMLLIRDAFTVGGFCTDALMIAVLAPWLAWISDTFGYTMGKKFGKTKLAPVISPNKTVAGAVGGLIGTPVVALLYFVIYSCFAAPQSRFASLSILQCLFILGVGLIGGFLGIAGDLAASYIKRETGIKDFGTLMPGHGGALDRIDGPLFTVPFTLFAFELYFYLFR